MVDPKFADTELANDVSLMPIGLRSMPPTSPAKPVRMAFPNTELVNARRARDTAAERQRVLVATQESLRIAEAASAAYQNGKTEGHVKGYRRGWKTGTAWGIFCGAFGTVVIGAVVVLYLGGHRLF